MDELERLARAHGTGGWQTLEDMVRFGRAVQAAERERWATAARLVVEATSEQLPMALDALRDVLRA